MTSKFNSALAVIFGLAALLGAADARATNMLTNGSFETLTSGAGQLGYNTNATGWTTNGYNFVYTAGIADTTGANGNSGNVKLWGPNDGSANGLPASSPDGGNFVAADGAYQVGAITQTVAGLIVGQRYAVSFWWAGAQQQGFDGITTEQWQVSLGGQTLSTAIVTDPNHGFTGWQYTTLTFTATSASEALSFLAAGTPSGEPPFSLLDGVTMSAVPEPSSSALFLTGLAFVLVAWRCRKSAKAAT